MITVCCAGSDVVVLKTDLSCTLTISECFKLEDYFLTWCAPC